MYYYVLYVHVYIYIMVSLIFRPCILRGFHHSLAPHLHLFVQDMFHLGLLLVFPRLNKKHGKRLGPCQDGASREAAIYGNILCITFDQWNVMHIYMVRESKYGSSTSVVCGCACPIEDPSASPYEANHLIHTYVIFRHIHSSLLHAFISNIM